MLGAIMLLVPMLFLMTLSVTKEDPPLRVTACWLSVDKVAAVEFVVKNMSSNDFSIESDRLPWFGAAIMAAHQGDALTGRGLVRMYPTKDPNVEIVTIHKKGGEIFGWLRVGDYFQGLEGVHGLRVFWSYELDGGALGLLKFNGVVNFDSIDEKCTSIHKVF